jgi:DNA-binding winged helix-turn-helix (wHTH) protein
MAIYRFGAFELDSNTGELTKYGRRVRLRPQPCAVLLHLVERSQTFVPRADLHRRLWPDGTFVNFDEGLNSCIKQVRAALGDAGRNPCVIETLSRRGYRFLLPVSASQVRHVQ